MRVIKATITIAVTTLIMVIPIDRVPSPLFLTDISTATQQARTRLTFSTINQTNGLASQHWRARCLRGESPYWLSPMKNHRTFCPHLGTYAQAADELRSDIALHMLGLDNEATFGLA
jgi:hypothetical protein